MLQLIIATPALAAICLFVHQLDLISNQSNQCSQSHWMNLQQADGSRTDAEFHQNAALENGFNYCMTMNLHLVTIKMNAPRT